MIFSNDTIQKAWKKAGGKCEECGRSLVFTHLEKSGERGAWNTHNKTGLIVGPDTPSNCAILCWRCFMRLNASKFIRK
ncbi:MAG: hypothetical protein WC002_01040 [Candidatus Muiribacteriota bacterium]